MSASKDFCTPRYPFVRALHVLLVSRDQPCTFIVVWLVSLELQIALHFHVHLSTMVFASFLQLTVQIGRFTAATRELQASQSTYRPRGMSTTCADSI